MCANIIQIWANMPLYSVIELVTIQSQTRKSFGFPLKEEKWTNYE